MPLPKKQSEGNVLGARWLNRLRGEVQGNRAMPGRGIAINKNPSGTTISSTNGSEYGKFEGTLVTVLNKTDKDLGAYTVAGIDDTTIEDDKTADGIADGIEYILRKPKKGDELSNYVILDEEIKADEAGRAYIRSDGVLARVRFEKDQLEDEDYAFARFEIDDEESSSTADKFFELKAAKSGDIRILERDTKEEDGNQFVWCIVRFCMHGGGTGTNDVPYRIGIDENDDYIHVENADGESWDRDGDAESLKQTQDGEEVDTDGIVIALTTRVEYFHDGNKILYGYQRRMTFDSAGRLVLVGPEVRYVVDEPEECSEDEQGGEAQQLMGG